MAKTLAELREHFLIPLGMSDAELIKKLESVGVEYAKPKSMAEEWGERVFRNKGVFTYACDVGDEGCGICIGPSPDPESALRNGEAWTEWITDYFSAFESAVRADERNKRIG
jgi:hypothetical protein